MSVRTSTCDAVFGNDPLGRFTAAIVTAVPEFDPGDTPIGHALASEFFQRLDLDAVQATSVEVSEATAPTELLDERVTADEIVLSVEAAEPAETPHVVLASERV